MSDALVWLITLVLLGAAGCSVHRLLPASVAAASTPAPARDNGLSEDEIGKVREIVRELPAFESDSLAQYEGEEIGKIHRDLDEVARPQSHRALELHFHRLDEDWEALIALDDILGESEVL